MKLQDVKKAKTQQNSFLNGWKLVLIKSMSEEDVRTGECLALIEYRVIPDKCNMCGLCQDACKYSAIQGEKKKTYRSGYLPFEIRQKRCTKCGECIKVCPTRAIEIVDIKQVEA